MNAHMGHIIHEVIFGSSVPGGVDLQGSFNPLLEWNKTDVNGRLHQNAFELLQNAWSILLQYTLIEIEYHYQDVACAVACSGVDSRLLYESSSHRVWNQLRAAVLSLPVHICTKSKFSHETFFIFYLCWHIWRNTILSATWKRLLQQSRVSGIWMLWPWPQRCYTCNAVAHYQ